MNANSASNNKHHSGGYRSQADFDEQMFGRGAGDPDMYMDPKAEAGNQNTTPANTSQESNTSANLSQTKTQQTGI